MSSASSSSLEYRIASAVHARFDALPNSCKPRVHPNGVREWIPLSGIVLVAGEHFPEEKITCISVATGAKCLPMSQIPQCRGLILHDSHAEVLALRALNYWLLRECKVAISGRDRVIPTCRNGSTCCSEADVQLSPSTSEVLQWRLGVGSNGVECVASPPLQLHPDIKLYMYGTCAPCGDASMELTMAAQEDATPWAHPSNKPSNDAKEETGPTLLDGRGYFSQLGVVRRKPSRADAEPTLSKSCSDKLAMKQVTSVFDGLVSSLIAPTRNAYLQALILPEDEVSDSACARAFGDGETGRMKSLREHESASAFYSYHPFDVLRLPADRAQELWKFGKSRDSTAKQKIGNLSVIWIAGSLSQGASKEDRKDIREVIINGVKQGSHMLSPNAKKGSVTCRAKMWDMLRSIQDASDALPVSQLDKKPHISHGELRRELETLQYCRARREASDRAKGVLRNWIENRGDDFWGLDVLAEVAGKKRNVEVIGQGYNKKDETKKARSSGKHEITSANGPI